MGNFAFSFHIKCMKSAFYIYIISQFRLTALKVLGSYMWLVAVANVLDTIGLDYSSLASGKRLSLNLTTINDKNSCIQVSKDVMVDSGFHSVWKKTELPLSLVMS